VPHKTRLSIACGDYDRTRPIKDGRVPVEGCDVDFHSFHIRELFYRAFRYSEFDVSELSFSSYLITTSRDTCPYIAIPVFVSRYFRHSSVYIRTDRGINAPIDLRGRTVALAEYQQSANVWTLGIFKDEHGLRPSDVHWVRTRSEERTPIKLPDDIDIRLASPGKTLNDMLASGEVDAIFDPQAPQCFVDGASNVGRLFPNYREVEEDYYRRTRIFPIMHLIGIRKDVANRYPWLARNLYLAFCAARDIALKDLREMGWPPLSLPWAEAETLDRIALMGKTFWPYGATECAHEIETMIRYAYDQGLLARKLSIDELFAQSTM